ncbi:MAG: Arm DNA-binding domain-containing protein, partial [Candidatus Adiutrix sp.]|nr:Arm DNA-binding domain-containing protein [Candidatus Adiutrix sp.]
MKAGNLSDVLLRSLKPGPKAYKKTDGSGLYLVVTPAGGKLWRIDYRFDGKRQTLSLGAWPVVTLAEAREKLLVAKREIKAGRNPAAAKQALSQAEKAAALTFEKVMRSFLEFKKEHGYEDRADSILSPLRKHVLPALGDRPLTEITAREILDALLAVKRLRLDETARRCRQYIGQVF